MKDTQPVKETKPLMIILDCFKSNKFVVFLMLPFLVLAIIWALHDSYDDVYYSSYSGSDTCGQCHTINHAEWKDSPHRNITNKPNAGTVVGDFQSGEWYLPEVDQHDDLDQLPAMKSYQQNGNYFMALRLPDSDEYYPFKIDRVVGYQYRQTFLTKESQGVLRRLPLQWSNSRGEFFSYWNEQEKSQHSVKDLWAQMKPLNSAWNLYCARCHTTHLQIENKNSAHTMAKVQWSEEGVSCETCHGPGQKHVDYMQHKPTNRLMSFVNNQLFNKPVPYMMTASKSDRGVALSVCARCHGSDILRKRMDIYRTYEPGFDKHGRLSDLSKYFTEAKLTPGSNAPTVEVWQDGRPKGLGMLFRSFADSSHYEKTDMRCYNCHNPHQNKAAVIPSILQPSQQSNEFCIECHQDKQDKDAEHSRHQAGTKGSFCYDCHMPKNIANLVSGDLHFVRSHNMGSIPNPLLSIRYGVDKSPNACNECHQDKSAQWVVNKLKKWGLDKHLIDVKYHLNRSAKSDSVH